MTEKFQLSMARLWRKIPKHSVMTLSTSSHERVSSRAVSVVSVGERFYFQTYEEILKYRQLSLNPNAALSFKNFSVEGKCRCIGKPNDEKNHFFITLFKKYFKLAYKQYSDLPNERLFEFTPTLIYSWEYDFNKPFMEYWNFEDKTYKKCYK